MSFSKSALPTPQELEAARQVPVPDAQGKPVLLGSLFEPDQIGGTAVVVFIRHFLCGLCKCSLRVLLCVSCSRFTRRKRSGRF